MSKPHLVLVHGGWQGSWAWERVVPLLTGRGFTVDALDLPGNGFSAVPAREATFDLHVTYVADRIRSASQPVWLVGHSGGGAVVSQAAEAAAENVAGLIYICGFMLPDGVGYSDLVDEAAEKNPAARGIWPYLIKSEDGETTRVPQEAAIAIFYHDCALEFARAAALLLRPQSERTRMAVPRLSGDRYGRLPRFYIETLQDRSVILPLQRKMLDLLPGTKSASLDSGHAPLLSQPEALSDLMAEAVA